MRVFRKLLKFLLRFVFIVAIVVVVGGFVFLEWPQILVNRADVAWVLKHANQDGARQVSYRDLQVETKSVSFWEKRIHLHLGPTCAQTKDQTGTDRICFQGSDLSLAYSFKNLVPHLTELGPIAVKDADARLYVVQKKPLPKLSIPNFAKNARVEPIHVDVRHFDYIYQDQEFRGSARVESRGSEIRLTTNVAGLTKGVPSLDANADLKAVDSTGKLVGPWGLDGKILADLRAKGKARVNLKLTPEPNDKESYTIRLAYNAKPYGTNATLSGVLQPDRLDGSLAQDIWLKPVKTPASKAAIYPIHTQIRDCKYDYFKSGGSSGKIQVNCPIAVDVPRLKSPKAAQAARALKTEHQARIDVTADIDTAYPPDPSKPMEGKIRVIPGPLFGEAIRTQGEAKVDFRAVPGDLPKFEKLRSNANFRLDIPEFQELVRSLAGTAFAVPAPAQVLRGSVHSELQANFTQEGGQGTAGFETHLNSPKRTQRVNVNGNGKFSVTRELAKADMDVLLNDVRLVLPKLGLGAPPQVFPDLRLPSKPKPPKPATPPGQMRLEYTLRVRTPQGKPVEIGSEYTKAPVPIDLNLASTEKRPLLGDITIEKVPLKIAGISQGIGRIDLHADTANQAGIFTGGISLADQGTRKSPIQIPATQAAGQAAGQAAPTRTPPQFSVPLSEIVSSILLGTPLDLVSTSPEAAQSGKQFPQTQEPGQPTILKFRHRY